MEFTIQELQIAGLCCRLYLPMAYHENEDRYPTIYVNGDIPIEEILTELVKIGVRTEFLLLSIKPESWNDDFTPWVVPAFQTGEEAPQGRADAYLSCLTEKIKPYIDAHYRTKPEAAHTALFGYSLGGLTAVYAMYKTDVFGAFASLSGSLWFDGFCAFMERGKPLRTDLRVYLSLGKKEKQSKNPRMARVAECTERVKDILLEQLEDKEDIYFEWNEGGHFHDIEGRFAKAIAWWAESGRA
ncbi:MAG: alpha/beta hydrolase [Lachnospiraceae bacterium]|nr:alpha/beta hydrolase [Lachnospiraceae bacterium]